LAARRLNPEFSDLADAPLRQHDWLSLKLAAVHDWAMIASIDNTDVAFLEMNFLGDDRGHSHYLISFLIAPGYAAPEITQAMLQAVFALAPNAKLQVLADSQEEAVESALLRLGFTANGRYLCSSNVRGAKL
jgi:hypothetical protein